MSRMMLRLVWRELNDGNGDVKVLALQVARVERDEDGEAVLVWEDVEVSNEYD